MTDTLTFKVSDLKKLYEHTVNAKDHRTVYGENAEPGCWLVGDHGVYLMSNVVLEEDEKPMVFFAKECNPDGDKEAAWWEVKRNTFGGDDGIEFLSAAWMKGVIEAAGSRRTFKLKFSPTNIQVVV